MLQRLRCPACNCVSKLLLQPIQAEKSRIATSSHDFHRWNFTGSIGFDLNCDVVMLRIGVLFFAESNDVKTIAKRRKLVVPFAIARKDES